MPAEIFCGVTSSERESASPTFRKFQLVSADFYGITPDMQRKSRDGKEVPFGHDGSFMRPQQLQPIDGVYPNPDAQFHFLYKQDLGVGYHGEYAQVDIGNKTPVSIHFSQHSSPENSLYDNCDGAGLDSVPIIPTVSKQILNINSIGNSLFRVGLVQDSVVEQDGSITPESSSIMVWHNHEFILIDQQSHWDFEIASVHLNENHIDIKVNYNDDDGQRQNTHYYVNLNNMPDSRTGMQEA